MRLGGIMEKIGKFRGIGTRGSVQSSISVVGIIAVVALFVVLATPLFLTQVKTIYDGMAQQTAGVVARELAGLMMMSTTPSEITIERELSGSLEYNITIENRMITVNQSIKPESDEASNIRMESESTQKLGVGGVEGKFLEVSKVTIQKTLDPDPTNPSKIQSRYEFIAD